MKIVSLVLFSALSILLVAFMISMIRVSYRKWPVMIDVGAGPLHLAAADGNLEKVKHLLDQGVDVDVRANPSRATPLDFAVRDGRFDVAKLLVDRGANVNARTSYSDTPLHFAAQGPKLYCANRERKGDLRGLPDEHLAIVQLLLKKGASPDPRDGGGATPLEYAATCNDVRIAKLLIAHGADINHRAHQYSVLDMAVYWGPDVAKLLIEDGVKVNTVTPYSHETPLCTAIRRGRDSLAKMLREHGATGECPS